MKRFILLAWLAMPVPADAQARKTDSTSLLYNQRQDSIKKQKRTADSLMNHKDTSWKRDNWVPDLDDKRKPAKKK
jgi:hypothetical protein